MSMARVWRVVLWIVPAAAMGCSRANIVALDAGDVGVVDASIDVRDIDFGDAACSAFPQAGCAAGQGCYVDPTIGEYCVRAGSGTEEAPCGSNADCAAGFGCITSNGVSACLRFCRVGSDCSDLGGSSYCVNTSAGVIGVCSATCNPINGAGCPTSTACAIDFAPVRPQGTSCRVAGAGGQGAPCAQSVDCQSGFTCANGRNQCLQFCVAGMTAHCPSGTVCSQATPPAIVAGVEYAVCVMP